MFLAGPLLFSSLCDPAVRESIFSRRMKGKIKSLTMGEQSHPASATHSLRLWKAIRLAVIFISWCYRTAA